MSKKFCTFLNNCITFHYHGISLCHEPKREYNFFPYEKNYLEKFLDERQKAIEDMQNGIYKTECEKCIHLNDFDGENPTQKIKKIELFNWSQCNCACFYCSNRNDTKLKIYTSRNQKGVIDVLPVLERLQKQDLLDESLHISSGGGEPTILKEYPKILKFVIKHKYRIDVLTNGILYEKYIGKAMQVNQESKIILSLDCGNRELFKKIKGVDKFNDVIKNLSKYVKDSQSPYQIIVKYIILKGVNDTKEDIDNWIETCKGIGIKSYMPSIEFCHQMNKILNSEIDPHIAEMYNYAKQKIKESSPDFYLQTHDFLEEAMNKIKTA